MTFERAMSEVTTWTPKTSFRLSLDAASITSCCQLSAPAAARTSASLFNASTASLCSHTLQRHYSIIWSTQTCVIQLSRTLSFASSPPTVSHAAATLVHGSKRSFLRQLTTSSPQPHCITLPALVLYDWSSCFCKHKETSISKSPVVFMDPRRFM